MKVIDIINEAPVERTWRGGRDDSALAGAAGAGAAGVAVATKNRQSVAAAADSLKVGGRFVRRYRGDTLLLNALAKVLPAALKKGALKAIPLAGIIIGGYFAAQQLAKGSIGGAALELGSSIGSAWTAVPATVWVIARDVYDQMYMDPADPDAFVSIELDLIKDPAGTKERLEFLRQVITKVVSDKLTAVQQWAATNKDKQEPSSARKSYDASKRQVTSGT